MKKILYILATVMLLLSCSKDVELATDSEILVPKGECKISAYINNSTKVDIDGTTLKWQANDYITVAEIGDNGTFNSSKRFNINTESISKDGKSADFYGDNLDANKKYIAVNGWANIADNQEYYQNLGVVGLLNIYGYINTQNKDNDDSHIESSWDMISSNFKIEDNNNISVEFNNISSYIKLNISMEEGANESIIKEINFTAPDKMFTTDFYIDSNCDIIYKVNTNEIDIKLKDEPTINSSNYYTAYIPFISNNEITEVSGNFTITIKTTDSKESSVTVPAKLLTEGKLYTKDLKFPEPTDNVASDREALIELYNATNGDNWTNNENWCSDKPLGEWYGVDADNNGRVYNLSLYSNNLDGYIPESIGALTELKDLRFVNNNDISGSIPESIGELKKLNILYLVCENISGNIPASIGNLTNLRVLSIHGPSYNSTTGLGNGKMSGNIPDIFAGMKNLTSLDLSLQQFSGTLPPSMGELTSLEYLYLEHNQLEGSIDILGNLKNLETISLGYNKFSGAIPVSFGELTNWNEIAWNIATEQQNGYGFSSCPDLYLEPSTITTIENKTINTQDYFSANNLTCVVLWRSWCGWSTHYLETLKELYSSYTDKGFGMISLNDEQDLTTIQNYVSNNSIPGDVCQLSGYDYSNGTNRVKYMPTSSSPTYAFVDSIGKVVFSESIYPFKNPSNTREEATIDFVKEYLGEPTTSPEDEYSSTDYSKDGEVITLQKATVGNGIDLVIVGDGFIDTSMESGGEYETRAKEAMEHFFSEEPYKTFRNRYNVYTVKAVSKNEKVNGKSETVFNCEFGDGTFIQGNDSKVFKYALKVPSISSTRNITIITILNSPKYAGTCYMYTDDSSIAYCPFVSSNDEEFRQIIVHECGGHGFGKLLDEYAYEGTIPSEDIEGFKWQKSIGWGANVDIVNDSTTIQWAHMLSDPRYKGLVGIYEGALTFSHGAYRPTDVSIMRYNTGNYNAPSREEIYRRIMEFSGGKFDYEEFVTYDAINRTASAQTIRTAQIRILNKNNFVPLAKPVMIHSSPKVDK